MWAIILPHLSTSTCIWLQHNWSSAQDVPIRDAQGLELNGSVGKAYDVHRFQGPPIVHQTHTRVDAPKCTRVDEHAGREHAAAHMDVADLASWVGTRVYDLHCICWLAVRSVTQEALA